MKRAATVAGVKCHLCRNATVGRGELCKCQKGRWDEIPLERVQHIGDWLRCAAFDTMED